MERDVVHEKVSLMIKNLEKEGEEAMLRGKYAKAFANLKRETDRVIGQFLVDTIGDESIKNFNAETGKESAEYCAFCCVAALLNYYLGKAIMKERSVELVDMLLDSAKDEYKRQLLQQKEAR